MIEDEHSLPIKIFTDGPLGYLVLNNPDTLNALTVEAILSLREGLERHESDPQVRAILICSESERAFCAGGQMKALRQSAINERYDEIDAFFEHEYALNLAIAQCAKPYIALIDGIAMGGGLGISIHGKYRVVTERAVLAMPESRIGFFPDVGASFFLQALDYHAAYWLGLTAISVNADESQFIGLATHRICRKTLPELIQSLRSALNKSEQNSDTWHTDVQNTLETFNVASGSDALSRLMESRANWFAVGDFQRIRQQLENTINNIATHESTIREDAEQLLSLLDKGSPYSASITLDLFERTKGLSLPQCLELERKLAGDACRHPDFIEGIRSVLVDKDRNPRWQKSNC